MSIYLILGILVRTMTKIKFAKLHPSLIIEINFNFNDSGFINAINERTYPYPLHQAYNFN